MILTFFETEKVRNRCVGSGCNSCNLFDNPQETSEGIIKWSKDRKKGFRLHRA